MKKAWLWDSDGSFRVVACALFTSLIIFSFAPFANAGTTITIFLVSTSTNPWVQPTDWNNASNTIEVIGGGKAGTTGTNNGNGGAGGGGGDYAKISNYTPTSTNAIGWAVGAGGATSGAAGGDTWFGTTGTVFAKGASSSNTTTGTTTATGGFGNAATGKGGGAGGGAASKYGAGTAGGSDGGQTGGGGGGGDGGGTGGSNAASATGANGGAAHDGTAGGTGGSPGNPGSHGSGGQGGTGGSTTCSAAGNGGNGVSDDLTATHGAGGGGGGGGGTSGNAAACGGGAGGLYGGGGGGGGGTGNNGKVGGSFGAGGAGIIIIRYDQVAPGAPGTPSISGSGPTTLALSWSASSNGRADTYKLEQCDQTPTCSLFTSITGVSTTTYSLVGNTQYDYAVKGNNAAGDGSFSATSSKLTIPSAPTALTVGTFTATTTALSWTAPTGGVGSYKLLECNGSCSEFTSISGVSTTTYGLTGNTTYTFKVRGTNNTGDGAYTASSTQKTLPDVPTGVQFNGITATSTIHSWTAPIGGADSYKLQRCTGGTTCSLSTGISGSPTTTKGLTGNTTYDYALRATGTAGDGLYTATSSVLTKPDVPGTPTYASVTDTTMTVNWVGSVGSSTSYKLERCITSTATCSLTTGIGTTTQAVSGLASATSYDFAVLGTNATGDGLWSATSTQATATTPPGTPGTPTYTNTIATTTGITWTASDPAATSYKLEQCNPSVVCSLFTGITSNSTTTYSLVGNTSYDYAVKGTNAGGDSAFSATSSKLTLPDRPAAPSLSNLAATSTTINWSAPTGGTATYKLQYCNGGCTLSTGLSVTSTSSNPLTGNTTYGFAIRGTNATGDGLYSATTTQLLVPDVPTGLSFSNIASTSMTVSWTAPTGGASTYKLQWCAGAVCTVSPTISGVSTSTVGLSPNTSYGFQVLGTNATGDGLYTATSTQATSAGTPGTPTFSNVAATSTTVSWTAPSGGADSYKLEFCTGGTTCILSTGITGVSTSTQSLTGNTSYDFAVRATVGGTDGGWSATSTQLTLPNIPGTPTFSNVAASTLTVSWTAPTGGASTYKVERCSGSGCTSFAEIATGVVPATYNDSGLTAATTYAYRIRATNATGDGLYSSAAETTTTALVTGSFLRVNYGVRLRGGTTLR